MLQQKSGFKDEILVMNYSTLLDDPDETEYLYVPFEMTKHGAAVDMTPMNLGCYGVLYVDVEYLPFGGIVKISTII